MTFSVASAIDSYVESQESVRAPDGLFHPSGLFGCARKTIYELRGTTPTNPRTARSRRILFIGSRLHEIVQGAVNLHPEVGESYAEVPIRIPDLNIIGSADQLIRIAGGWELEEYKTINSRAFAFGDLPKEDHVGQAGVYMYALRAHGSRCMEHPPAPCTDECINIPPLGDALKRVRIAYVSKDDLLIGEHIVEWNDEIENKLVQKIEYLRSFVPPSLPPRLPFAKGSKSKKDWRCGYCPFLDRCWDVDQPERATEYDDAA